MHAIDELFDFNTLIRARTFDIKITRAPLKHSIRLDEIYRYKLILPLFLYTCSSLLWTVIQNMGPEGLEKNLQKLDFLFDELSEPKPQLKVLN